jgi:flagellar biogenesis protein FliO
VEGTLVSLLGGGSLSGWSVALQFIGALVALALVLLLAWVVLRWVNKRRPGYGGGNASRAIRVLDRVVVGRNSTLLLLRVKDTVMLVAVSEHAIQKLAEYDASEADCAPHTAADLPSFAQALRDAGKKLGLGKKDGGDGDEKP